MDAFLSVILEVAVILILILVGYFTVKKGMFTKESLGSITSFLLYIVTPCLIVSSFLSAESGKLDGWTLLLAAVLPALSIVISIALSYLFFRREPSGRRRVLRFSMIFCNVGFMGTPLVEGIVGSEGVLYGSFFIAVFNIFCWTYGYVMMGGGKVPLIGDIIQNQFGKSSDWHFGSTLSLLVMVVVLAFMGALNRIDREEAAQKEVRIL